MAHNIATINGNAAVFAGRGMAAWHKLGTTIEGCATWQDAIKLALIIILALSLCSCCEPEYSEALCDTDMECEMLER